MRGRILVTVLSVLTLAWTVDDAKAGAITYVGKQLAQGTASVAQTTANGGKAVANGAATLGEKTGGAVKTGAVPVAKEAPAAVAHGTARAAKKVWRVIW